MNIVLAEEENQRLLNLLAVLAENRRLRAAVTAAGLPLPVSSGPSMATLALVIADLHDRTVNDIQGPSCARDIVICRQHFVWAARQAKDGSNRRWPDSQIARFIGQQPSAIARAAARHKQLAAAQQATENACLLQPQKERAA